MSLIKVNHNNAAVKLPVAPIPSLRYSRSYYDVDGITVDKVSLLALPNINDPFFTGYEFEIYLNGSIIGYVTDSTDNEIVITDNPELRKPSFTVQIKGRYFGANGYVHEFELEVQTLRYYYLCSESTYCGEDVLASDYYEGYYHDGVFYATFDSSEIGNVVYGDTQSLIGSMFQIAGPNGSYADPTYVMEPILIEMEDGSTEEYPGEMEFPISSVERIYSDPLPAIDNVKYFDIQTGRLFTYNGINHEYDEIA